MPKIMTITGPTCSGKTTLQTELTFKSEDFAKVISTTTRGIRPGEVDGADYKFTSKVLFERMIANGDLIEFTEVGGEYYGLPKAAIESLGEKTGVFVCDPNGVQSIRAFCDATEGWIHKAVYVDNPIELLAKRFVDRVVNAKPSYLDSHKWADRMLGMIVEANNWDVLTSYDYFFDTFDEHVLRSKKAYSHMKQLADGVEPHKIV